MKLPHENLRLPLHVRRHGVLVSVIGTLALAAVANVSAHFVRRLPTPGLYAAFVSSPTNSGDALINLAWSSGSTTFDTGLKVACFHVANSSTPHPDNPAWPRVTAIGFELPGSPAGFKLLSPSGNDWDIEEHVSTSLAGKEVELDFVIRAQVNPTGRTPGQPNAPIGIQPGYAEFRGSGPAFCVSGPFPSNLSIEGLINGVVVEFHDIDEGPGAEFGVWYPPPPDVIPPPPGPGPVPRPIPLY